MAEAVANDRLDVMTQAREFYETHFLGNYDDWSTQPLDKRRAAMNLAVSEPASRLGSFEDRQEHDPNRVKAWLGRYGPHLFRLWLQTRCQDFCVIYDLADTHKHMRLRNAGRVVETGRVDGAFDEAVFDNVDFDTPHLEIVRQDGSTHRFPDIMRNVTMMWEALFT